MHRFRIANMNCGGCAKGVTATLDRIAAGVAVRIDLAAREVSLDTPDPAALVAALRADGWNAEAAEG